MINKKAYSFNSSVNERLFVEKSFVPKGKTERVKYYRYNGQKLTSVSKILTALKEPFDEIGQSIKCSENENHKHFGKTPQEIRDIWTATKEHSWKIGHALDDYIQATLKGDTTEYIKNFDALDNRNVQFDLFKRDIIDKYNLELIAMEDPIIDVGLMILGKPDAIFLWNGYIVIFDWKSNETIDKESYFKLLPPFAHLDTSKYTTYTIQVHLYRWILEKSYNLDYRIKDCRIAHFTGTGYELMKPKFEYNAMQVEEFITVALNRIHNQ